MAEAADGELTARCHCGAVTIRMARTPTQVLQCNCSLCTATGWRGVYFSSDELSISGEFDRYVRADIAEPSLVNFRCAHCGCATHWEPLAARRHERMGVNANLLPPDVIKHAELVLVDGRSWPL